MIRLDQISKQHGRQILFVEAEAAIQENLYKLMQGKTVIAIAHRLSTVAKADRVLVFDGGRLVEAGSPAELAESDGAYARLIAAEKAAA